MKQEDKEAMADEVLGSGMGSIALERLGKRYGLEGNDIDLQVCIIIEELGVWNCNTCNWWVEEAELHNDICSDCYALDNDE